MIDVGHEQATGDEMNGDDMNRETPNGDDFWGATPDWTDDAPRPRRSKRSGAKSDVTGAIKGLWASAMTAGADATREHGVLDATASDPTDDLGHVDSAMFDDIDDDFSFEGFASDRPLADPADGWTDDDAPHPTTEVPVIDVFDDEQLAAVAPVSMSERRDRRSGGIDPLLVRVGAVAIATTLLVPLAIGLTSDGDDGATLSSATTEAVAAAPSLETEPATDDAPAEVAPGTPVGLDPASLPPAVPVNPDPSTSADGVDQPAASSGASDEFSSDTASSAPEGSDDAGDADGSSDSNSASDVMADEDDASTSGDDAASADDGIDDAATADDVADRNSNCAIDYTVVAGDFWLRLAEAAGVPLAELLEANGASVNTPLYPGSEICLPAGSTTPAPPSATTTPATTEAPTTTAAPTTTEAPTTTATPTTTDAPTTTAAPDPTPNTDATPEEVQQIIRDVWPDELEERALEIAFRESRYVPTAKNFCCYGIFQIYWEVHKSWLADIGITNDQQLYDPETNARAAYALYERAGGWGPWSQTNY